MTFHLYEVPERYGRQHRFMIDSASRSAPIKGSCVASCWLEAKRKLQFELTPMQAEMLKNRSF